MITPYTQAAQAPRLDIYDPFPFQEVASMALRKDKAYGDFLNTMDKYSSEIGNIETATAKDSDYLKGLKMKLDSTITDAVTKGVDLGDGIASRELMKEIYKNVDLKALSKIKATTAGVNAYKEDVLKKGEKHDPIMDITSSPINELDNWDSSTQGSWKGQASEYQDYLKDAQLIMDDLKTSVLSRTNGIVVKGVDDKAILSHAINNADNFSKLPNVKYNIERIRRQGGGFTENDRGEIVEKSDAQIAAELLSEIKAPYYDLDYAPGYGTKGSGESGASNAGFSYHINIDGATAKAKLAFETDPKNNPDPTGTPQGITPLGGMSYNYPFDKSTNSYSISGTDLAKLPSLGYTNVKDYVKLQKAGIGNDMLTAYASTARDQQEALTKLNEEKAGKNRAVGVIEGTTNVKYQNVVDKEAVKRAQASYDLYNNKLKTANEQLKASGLTPGAALTKVSEDELLRAQGKKLIEGLEGVDFKFKEASGKNTMIVDDGNNQGSYLTKVTTMVPKADFDAAVLALKKKEGSKYSGADIDKIKSQLGMQVVPIRKSDFSGVKDDGKQVEVYSFDMWVPHSEDANIAMYNNLSFKQMNGITDKEGSAEQSTYGQTPILEQQQYIEYLKSKNKDNEK